MEEEKLYKKLPDNPGVYLMRDKDGTLLYVGKATSLRRRVSSYFLRPHDRRISQLVSRIAKIDYEETDTAIEALIREAELIKEHTPPFNIREKDDKSFLYVEITKEPFPRVMLNRGRDLGKVEERIAKRYGPFTSASSLRDALKIIRRIFPYSTHPSEKLGQFPRPCFEHEIGVCPGTCIGAISKEEYKKNIHNIELFFAGKKERILKALQKDMEAAAKKLEFEKAEVLRRRIFSLKHIQDIAFLAEDKIADPDGNEKDLRIEGYDISNISGVSAVGSMVVFIGDKPDKNEYRKFKIKGVETTPTVHPASYSGGDVGMMTEVLTRRFARSVNKDGDQWPLPDIVLVDGGIGQVNAARQVLKSYDLNIPVIGLAKGPQRKRNDVVGLMPKKLKHLDLKTLMKVRDEAHRFAISYHKNLRGRNFFE
jgi:excinuclease ABC subunit C